MTLRQIFLFFKEESKETWKETWILSWGKYGEGGFGGINRKTTRRARGGTQAVLFRNPTGEPGAEAFKAQKMDQEK
jgi:hypothetical protein